MIDRLRALANRPIRAEDRGKAFLLATVAVVAALIALLSLGRPEPKPREARPVSGPPTPTSPAEQPPPQESTPAPEQRGASPAELKQARRVANRFFRSYLAYSYGRASLADLEAASPELRRELAARPARVPATVRKLKPRILTTQLEAEGGIAELDAVALVDDGDRTYSSVAGLERAGSSWQVSELGG